MHGVDTFVKLLGRFVCQLTISFHTFLCVTSHVVGPRSNTKILRVVNNILTYFTLSLSTSQVFMIQERRRFSQINFFVEYFPHRINVLRLRSQFDVIHRHR